MSVSSFQELYVEELRDLYSAERQLIEALPKVAKACSSPELSKAVEKHLKQTTEHAVRLERIFVDLGEKPTGHKCKAMEGLIEEGNEIIEEVDEGPLRDAALIGAAQKIEHYEIAGYGTARTFAEQLGQPKHIELLQATLDEEAATDKGLTEIAMGIINDEAAVQGEDRNPSAQSRKKETQPV
jgi:ferritin-like metal-binding protein YciE